MSKTKYMEYRFSDMRKEENEETIKERTSNQHRSFPLLWISYSQ